VKSLVEMVSWNRKQKKFKKSPTLANRNLHFAVATGKAAADNKLSSQSNLAASLKPMGLGRSQR
jgi:hypothetical protein